MFTNLVLEGSSLSGLLGSPIGMLLIVSVVWVFLVILPGRKEAKRKQAMLDAVKKGDMVQTQAGIIGKVSRTEPTSVVIDSAGSKIEVLRSSVVQILDKKSD